MVTARQAKRPTKTTPTSQTSRGLTDELVLDAKTGKPRQAGTLGENSQFVLHYKKQAEKSLYLFGKTIMGYNLLTSALHLPYCRILQNVPPYRKLTLMPRLHYKTTVAKALIIHTFIQPPEHNCYYPDNFPLYDHADGRSGRVLVASQTVDLSRGILGELAQRMIATPKLRALWPHCFWENAERQSPAWNRDKLTLPRNDIAKEASIEATGVDGTKEGFHYDFHVFDDLIGLKARNSTTIMQTAIEWFTASRAFMEDQEKTREFTSGTHWAVNDLYTHIRQKDPTVECYTRSIIEDGHPILPERFPLDIIERMKQPPPLGYGVMFPLLFMNSVLDPALVDFDMTHLRYFILEDGFLQFDEEERDTILHEFLFGTTKEEPKPGPMPRGIPSFGQYHAEDFDAKADYMATRYG